MIGSIPRGHPCIIRIKNPATGELDRYWALAKCPHSFDGAHEVWVPYLLGRSAGRDWVWVAQNEMHEPLACTPRFVVRYWQSGKLGTQVATFIEQADADAFAVDKRLYGKRATVEPLTAGAR